MIKIKRKFKMPPNNDIDNKFFYSIKNGKTVFIGKIKNMFTLICTESWTMANHYACTSRYNKKEILDILIDGRRDITVFNSGKDLIKEMLASGYGKRNPCYGATKDNVKYIIRQIKYERHHGFGLYNIDDIDKDPFLIDSLPEEFQNKGYTVHMFDNENKLMEWLIQQ
jgi:hypothetical protein